MDINSLIKTTNKNIDDYKKKDSVSFNEILINSNILEFTMGTVIGFATNQMVLDISKYYISPIIESIINYYKLSVSILGVPLNINKIVQSIIYFIFIIIVVYIAAKYLLKTYAKEIFIQKKIYKLEERKNNLYNTLINKNINRNTQLIHNILQKRYFL